MPTICNTEIHGRGSNTYVVGIEKIILESSIGAKYSMYLAEITEIYKYISGFSLNNIIVSLHQHAPSQSTMQHLKTGLSPH